MAREVKRSYLDKNYDQCRYWTAIPLSVTNRNCELEMQYLKRKQELRTQGRTEEEVSDRSLFGCCDKYDDVEAVSVSGLQCGMKFLKSCLGNATKGVSLSKHADVFLRKCFDDGLQSCWLIIFKVMYGRVKGVLPIQTPPYREPALDADCHCSFISPSVDDPLHLQEIKSQVYMFERDPSLPTSFSARPRQCVPVAVVMYNRIGSLSDAVDLRLVANDRHPAKSTDGGGHSDVSVVVGQAGRRCVVVSRSQKPLVSGSDAVTTSESHKPTSHRSVLSCPSGTITKITITNDGKRSDVVGHSPSQMYTPRSTSSTSSSDNTKTAVLSPSTGTTTAAEESTSAAGNRRLQYSHLIRRRKKTESTTESSRDRTESSHGPLTEQTSLPLPRADDTPLTLLECQKTIVGDITKKLSVELNAVTSFLRVTKPAHVDERERIAIESMQRVNAAYQRLTPVCLKYRQFCRSAADAGLPDVDAMRVHDSTLRRCRDKLTTSFSERRDVILQTPIAGQQRLFTFVWLQRHATTIIDCINVIVDVLDAVLSPLISSAPQTSPESASNSVNQHEVSGRSDAILPIGVEVKPNISRLDAECARLGLEESTEDAGPPSLIPALKTDVDLSAVEPPVLEPYNCPRHVAMSTSPHEQSVVVTSQSQRRRSLDDRRCLDSPTSRRVDSTSSDQLIVSITQSVKVKQEPDLQENISTVQPCSTSADTVRDDHSEMLRRSEAADLWTDSGIIPCTTEEDAKTKDDDLMMRDELVNEQIQRLLDARDQKAFSQLLIDSLCSMPSDDFHRVRQKLIRKFTDDQRRLDATSNDNRTATTRTVTEEGTDRLEEGLSGRTTENDALLSLKIVNVRSCSVEETAGPWSDEADSSSRSAADDRSLVKSEQVDSSSWSGDFTDVDKDNRVEDVTTTNYITVEPIETTTEATNSEVNDTPSASTDSHHEPRYTDEQAQRPQADRRESREWISAAAARCLTSAGDAETSSLKTVNASAGRHRRASIPTSPAVRGPWLFTSRSPANDQSSAVVRGRYRRPPAFTRRHSSPSPLKCRRRTEMRFPSSDRERRAGREPAWLSEMTPKQHRGSMSLHCCVAIVSRCLHAAGARRYGAYFAEECRRQRRMTDKLDDIDDRLIRGGWQFTGHTSPVSDRDHADAVAHVHQTDDGQRRNVASSHRRSVVVTDSRLGQRNETYRRARNRSGSDSDSTHRPCIRDLRYHPPSRFAQNWRGGAPYSMRSRLRGRVDTWHSPGQSRHKTSTNDRSAADRKSKKEERHRHSVSSERSSSTSASSSSSSRSRSKDRFNRSKHSSADEQDDKSEQVKSTEKIPRTESADCKDAENIHDTTDEPQGNTTADNSPDVDNGNADHANRIDRLNEYNDDDVNVQQGSIHDEATADIGKAFDIESEVYDNSASSNVHHYENTATSDSGLKNLLSENKTPTVDDKVVDKIEPEDTLTTHSNDSYSTIELVEKELECIKADGNQISQSGKIHRYSRSGSRPRSSETAKSDSSVVEHIDHRTELTSDGRKRQKHRHSKKRSRSSSKDGRKRKSSIDSVNHEHRTKSRHSRHERKRSRGKRRSRSSSQGPSPSSKNDLCSSSKRSRTTMSSDTAEDQASGQRRLKTEQKRLEKLRKKAKKAFQKLQRLETHPLWKKTMMTVPSVVPQVKDTVDVNSNRTDWNFVGNVSDRFADAKSADVYFIDSYTSPVSSPASVLSEAEKNSSDNPPESCLQQTPGEKQCEENDRQIGLCLQDSDVVTVGDSRDQLTAAVKSPYSSYTFVSTRATDPCNDNELRCNSICTVSAVTATTTDLEALQAVAVADNH